MLRSSSAGILAYYTVNLKRSGGTSFSHYAPKIWNCLPNEVREFISIHIFKKRVKTYLFKVAYEHNRVWSVCNFAWFYFTSFNVRVYNFIPGFYFPIFAESLFKVLIILYWCCFFNICFMLVKHFELHSMYEKCYTNKLLLLIFFPF